MTRLIRRMLEAMEKVQGDYMEALALREMTFLALKENPFDLRVSSALTAIEESMLQMELALSTSEYTLQEIARWN